MAELLMTELPMTELPMTRLPMTELPMKEYDGGALSEDDRLRGSSFGVYLVCAAAALAHTWHAQQQLWRTLSMRSSSVRACLDDAKVADAHTQSTMQPP